MITSPKVYIVVLNYNGWKDTIECLCSLLRLDYLNFRIVVVDNYSSNDSVSQITRWLEKPQDCIPENSFFSETIFKEPLELNFDYNVFYNTNEITPPISETKITFLCSSVNNGFAPGNNIGLRYALQDQDTQYFWLLNNDVIVEKKSLGLMVNSLSQKEIKGNSIGLLASKIFYYYEPNKLQGIGGNINSKFIISKHIGEGQRDEGQFDNSSISSIIDYPIGASLFFNKNFVEDVGLLCEEYFLYFEEIDWVLRGKQKGWVLGFDYLSQIFHKEGSSSGASNQAKIKSLKSDYYFNRNRIIICNKFFKESKITLYIGLIISIFRRCYKLEFKHALMVTRLLFTNVSVLQKK